MNSPHVISTKEMKERTQRLRMNDPTMLEKQRKEAEERRKLASRVQQKNFSSVCFLYKCLWMIAFTSYLIIMFSNVLEPATFSKNGWWRQHSR